MSEHHAPKLTFERVEVRARLRRTGLRRQPQEQTCVPSGEVQSILSNIWSSAQGTSDSYGHATATGVSGANSSATGGGGLQGSRGAVGGVTSSTSSFAGTKSSGNGYALAMAAMRPAQPP